MPNRQPIECTLRTTVWNPLRLDGFNLEGSSRRCGLDEGDSKPGFRPDLIGVTDMGHKALYGKIPYFGGAWNVTFEPELRDDGGIKCTSQISGYGQFPFDDYPGIPVIDLRDDDVAFESCGSEGPSEPGRGEVPLEDYLDWYRSRGVRIINDPNRQSL